MTAAARMYPLAPSTGSRLIDCLSYRYLKPVRGDGPTVHLVERDIAYTVPLALCGAEPTMTERGAPTWRQVHAVGVHICMGCHALSCSVPSRIDWNARVVQCPELGEKRDAKARGGEQKCLPGWEAFK